MFIRLATADLLKGANDTYLESDQSVKPENTNLLSTGTGLDLTKKVKLLFVQHKQKSWVPTGGQAYSETFPLPSNWVFSYWTKVLKTDI